RAIAEHFAWVHSVDREKIARRLSDQRPGHLPPLNICLQVNIDNEPSKSGVPPEQVAELALRVAALPGLRLRGLMAIPEPATTAEKQRLPFFRLRQLLATLRGLAPELAELDTLSMGMSGDLAAAIAEGATLVRVGTAIFGARDRQLCTTPAPEAGQRQTHHWSTLEQTHYCLYRRRQHGHQPDWWTGGERLSRRQHSRQRPRRKRPPAAEPGL